MARAARREGRHRGRHGALYQRFDRRWFLGEPPGRAPKGMSSQRSDGARRGPISSYDRLRTAEIRFPCPYANRRKIGVTARPVAQPPKAAFVTRLRSASYPAKPLVSYQTYRQLSGWILPPLVTRAFSGHTSYRGVSCRPGRWITTGDFDQKECLGIGGSGHCGALTSLANSSSMVSMS